MLLRYIPEILFRPRRAFEDARDIDSPILSIVAGLLVPLALVAPIAAYLGTTLVGWKISEGATVKLSHLSAGKISIAYFAGIVLTTLLIARLIQWMSSTYGKSQSYRSSLVLAVLAAVPLYLCGISQAYPVIWVNYLIGLPMLCFSVYLLFLGIEVLLETDKSRAFLFGVAVLAVGMVAIVALLAGTVVLWKYGIGPEFISDPTLI